MQGYSFFVKHAWPRKNSWKKTLDTMVGWVKSAKGSALMHLNIYITFDIVYQPTKFNIGPYGMLASDWDKLFSKVC